MGNLEINTSMKTLDFEARTAVAKECIHRLCGISGTRADRKSDPRINQMIGKKLSLVIFFDRNFNQLQFF